MDPVPGSRVVAALSTGLQVLRLRALSGSEAGGNRLQVGLGRLAERDVEGLLIELDKVNADIRSRPDPTRTASVCV